MDRSAPPLRCVREGSCSELRDARVELVVQLPGIDRCTNGDDLRTRRTVAPLVEFGDFRATSHYLEGKTCVRGVGSKDDPLTMHLPNLLQ